MSATFHEKKLDNGLTIIAEVNDADHTAAVGFFVRTGARDETPEIMGVSHFLEHMMFKGTPTRTADDVNRQFDQIGANYNAFTSHEQTVYYAHVLPEYLPNAVDLFSDMLRPSLRTDDFDMEKNVILEEIGMYDDRPEWRLQDTTLEKYFGEHTLGYRVLGTGGDEGTVTKLTPEQMRAYFQQRYSPDNIIVAAAGKLDFDNLCDDLAKRCGNWQPMQAARQYTQPTLQAQDVKLDDDTVQRSYLAMLCPGPSAQDDSRYAARVLAELIGDDDGSRLYWALIDPGLAEAADFSVMPMDQLGCYMAFACCPHDRLEQVRTTLLGVIDSVADDLSDDEIERARHKIATKATISGERPTGRMQMLGGQWMYHGRYRSLAEEIERLMQVDRDEIMQLLRAHPMTPRTVVTLAK